ncbi:unnamed protein product, partial [Mesorhabditis belari]|uniref:Neurotransmitter-gated ion-channel ligand-binding domain-containing protein n=1 Tax=Mesorhabditis belari TaxID=2138241 RepID=A0AAF3J374_9BILA
MIAFDFPILFPLFTFFHITIADGPEEIDYTEFGARTAYSTAVNNNNKLYYELFQRRNYYKDLAPIEANLNASSPVDERFAIVIKLQLLALVELDVVRQTLRAYIEVEMGWQDIRLAWNRSAYDIGLLWVHCDSIWTPEDFVTNTIQITEVYPDRFKQCRFDHNGSVYYDQVFLGDFTCPMDISKFPFDTQDCTLQFGSNSYQWFRINQTGELFTKYKDYSVVGNSEFGSTNCTMRTETAIGTMDTIYQSIIFDLKLKREPNFYIYVIALPSFLLTFLSIIGCFWTPNVKEEQLTKLSVALTSMMSMTTLIDLVSQEMPKTKKFPLLGIFILACVFITSISW